MHHSFWASVFVHLYLILNWFLILVTSFGVFPLGLDSHFCRMS